MEGYKGYSDEELIEKLRAGNAEIIDYIMDKYKDLVRKKARALYLMGGDNDDLIQEGMIGLFKAIRDYQESREASFYHFADLCISRQMYSAIEASNRKKHTPLNSYISLYSGTTKQDEQMILLQDILPSVQDGNPEDLVIHQESVKQIEQEMKSRLSKFEQQVLDCFLQGLDYLEIGEILGKEAKSIDNALQRIRKKLSLETY